MSFILIEVLRKPDAVELAEVLRSEIEGYFRGTGLILGEDVKIETARTYDPLTDPSEPSGEGASKAQLRLLHWRIALVSKTATSDPRDKEQQEAIMSVYNTVTVDETHGYSISKMQASSLIDAANDFLDEMETK